LNTAARRELVNDNDNRKLPRVYSGVGAHIRLLCASPDQVMDWLWRVVFYERGMSRENFSRAACLRTFLRQPALNLPVRSGDLPKRLPSSCSLRSQCR